MSTIEVNYIEDITTADVSNFISTHVKSRGLKPKTANRYREIIHRLFSWAIEEQGVRMPANINPVAKVAKYRENASEIRFLDLKQVDEQLNVLAGNKLLQTLVAVYI